MAQPGVEISGAGQDQRGAVAVLGVGRMDHRRDQHAIGVGEDVTLAAFDLFAGVISMARRPRWF